MIILVLSYNCRLGVSYSISMGNHLVFVIMSGRLDMHVTKRIACSELVIFVDEYFYFQGPLCRKW